MKRIYGARRGIGMAMLAVTAAICIAACGGSSNASSTTKSTATGTTTTASKSSTYTALRTCMSKHGVTLPNRTGGRGAGRGFFGGGTGTTSGGTGTGTTPAGGPPAGAPGAGGGFGGGGFAGGTNSKFAKALKACGGKAGGFGGGFRAGGGYGGAPGAGHFRPTFSKATLTAFVACVRKNGYPAMPEAKTNAATGGFFPASVEKNAKFQKASVKCASILRKATTAVNPGGPNQPSTTTTSSSSSST